MSADEIRTEAKRRLLEELTVRQEQLASRLHERKVQDKIAELRSRIEKRADEPVFVQLDLGADASAEEINNAYRLVTKLIGALSSE